VRNNFENFLAFLHFATNVIPCFRFQSSGPLNHLDVCRDRIWFIDVGKNLLKRNTTVSKRKTGDPYSTRIVPMADIYIYIYIYIYIFVVKFLGECRPPAAFEFIQVQQKVYAT